MKYALAYLTLFIVLGMGCSSPAKVESPDVMTSIPILSLIVEPIVGDLSVETLLSTGVSPHSYQPRPSEMQRLQTASLVVTAHEDVDGWAGSMAGERTFVLFGAESAAGQAENSDTSHDAHFWSNPDDVVRAIPQLVDRLCSMRPASCPAFRRRATMLSVRIDSVATVIGELFESQTPRPCVITAQPFVDRYLDRFDIARIGPITQSPEYEPSPASLSGVLENAQMSECSTLLLQNTVANSFMMRLAVENQWRTITLDALGGEATSYEEYLLEIARTLVNPGI